MIISQFLYVQIVVTTVLKRVKLLPKYRCSACQHEFDEPIYKSLEELISIFYENEDAIDVRERCFVTKDKWQNKNNLLYIKLFPKSYGNK